MMNDASITPSETEKKRLIDKHENSPPVIASPNAPLAARPKELGDPVVIVRDLVKGSFAVLS